MFTWPLTIIHTFSQYFMLQKRKISQFHQSFPPFLQTSRFATVLGVPSSVAGSAYDYEGSLASRNPGFYGYSRSVSSWKRKVFFPTLQQSLISLQGQMKRSICVGLSDTCGIRSGLMGTLIKMPCCPGSYCTHVGHSFKCVPMDYAKEWVLSLFWMRSIKV